MQSETFIRILETETNRVGDLFGRLMVDLFVALGYEKARLNIHKSGRELDLDAIHRLERRRAIAECKATAETIGGSDLNKFVGVLDVEQGDAPISGYFISLSGFKETALEQEKNRKTRITTLTGSQVVDEMVNGRIIITKEKAADLAGRCCSGRNQLVLDPNIELLAHERGWIWCVYYLDGKCRTHFVLIHADGTPLNSVIVKNVVDSDKDCKGNLHTLACLNPGPRPGGDDDPQMPDAVAAYGRYLSEECGFIQLDGLPADSDVGSRRLKFENLFVPLHLDVNAGNEQQKRQAVGTVLANFQRLAILAAPGGGKSTLLKRLAVAYADPARRAEIDDNLPQRGWVPLFFRCRELRNLARGSFAELLGALCQREPVRQFAEVFASYVDRALLAGRILLLVDGLDEISDEGDRAAFVCTLRTAAQAYPGTAMVITSREAGFRHIAAHLAPVCTQAVLSPFDEMDICRLTVTWHREVVGDSEKVRADAEHLAETICRNDRIRRLAINPLLLTTLLLVKRWVGSLPTRRAILYGKAVEVLLMTWNTEGHDPIPDEEAIPQLCYLASAMMLDGIQKISRPRLAKILQEAREKLPTELGYVQGTVEEFIHRVEDRSSLLMMTGHDIEDGQLVEYFEFRHLTFQEFLTARAMVEGWHPGRTEDDSLTKVLTPHFTDDKWREVIPLAAVLGGKATEELIKRLTSESRISIESSTDRRIKSPIAPLLGLCLSDEAAARPETVRAALREVARNWDEQPYGDFRAVLATGKYGGDLRVEAGKLLLAPTPIFNASLALAETVCRQTIDVDEFSTYSKGAWRFVEMLKAPDRLTRCEGALGSVLLSFWLATEGQPGPTACGEPFQQLGPALAKMLDNEDAVEQYVACFALVWVGACRVWSPMAKPELLKRLVALWRGSPIPEIADMAGWAFASQSIESRNHWPGEATENDGIKELLEKYDQTAQSFQVAFLVLAWYTRSRWKDEEIAKLAKDIYVPLKEMRDRPEFRTLGEIIRFVNPELQEPRKQQINTDVDG
jgi:hypothetical protein